MLSAAPIFGRDSSFWHYKVCPDIRAGSVGVEDSGSRVNARLEHLFLAFDCPQLYIGVISNYCIAAFEPIDVEFQ